MTDEEMLRDKKEKLNKAIELLGEVGVYTVGVIIESGGVQHPIIAHSNDVYACSTLANIVADFVGREIAIIQNSVAPLCLEEGGDGEQQEFFLN